MWPSTIVSTERMSLDASPLSWRAVVCADLRQHQQARLSLLLERCDSTCVLEHQRYHGRVSMLPALRCITFGGAPNKTLMPAKSSSFVRIANPPSRAAVHTFGVEPALEAECLNVSAT